MGVVARSGSGLRIDAVAHPIEHGKELKILPKSMTGYGRGNCVAPTFSVTVELRSVNYRYADYFLRIPREFYIFEDRIRRLLQGKIGRGRIEVNVTLHRSAADRESAALDGKLASAYYRALLDLAADLGIPPDINLGELVRLPGVLDDGGGFTDEDLLWPHLESALQEALEGLLQQRAAEGGNLSRDLQARLSNLEALVEELAGLTPLALEEQRKRLESRLQERLADNFDESRLLMECAVLAEKMDVHEEIVRLKSHLKAFGRSLRQQEGPIGRRLDFIAQEIFREVNTVGAKAQDYRLTALVVEIKTELDKMREQIQNIE